MCQSHTPLQNLYHLSLPFISYLCLSSFIKHMASCRWMPRRLLCSLCHVPHPLGVFVHVCWHPPGPVHDQQRSMLMQHRLLGRGLWQLCTRLLQGRSEMCLGRSDPFWLCPCHNALLGNALLAAPLWTPFWTLSFTLLTTMLQNVAGSFQLSIYMILSPNINPSASPINILLLHALQGIVHVVHDLAVAKAYSVVNTPTNNVQLD